MDRLVGMVKVVAAGDMRMPPGAVRRVFGRIRAGATPEESELTYAPGRLNGLRRRFRRDAKTRPCAARRGYLMKCTTKVTIRSQGVVWRADYRL